MTPCHSEKYAEALTGMRQWASKMWQGGMPPWGQAAMEQHAHYYASKACGELDMPLYNNSIAQRAALGITRVGDDRSGRAVSLGQYGRFAGFGAAKPTTLEETKDYYASTWLDEGCKRGSTPGMARSNFCYCMWGDADYLGEQRTKDEDGKWKENADVNFRSGSPGWACQMVSGYLGNPWTDENILIQIVGSGGRADPFTGLSVADRIKAYKKLIESVGDKEIGIPGVLSFKVKDVGGMLEKWGVVPAGSLTGGSASSPQATATVENASPSLENARPWIGATNPWLKKALANDAWSLRVAGQDSVARRLLPEFLIDTTKEEETSNTALLIGGGVAILALVFLLKK